MWRRVIVVLGVTFVFSTSPGAKAQTWLGPTPYLSEADSPFAPSLATGDVVLEDFEDGTLDLPGVTSNGAISAPGPATDSVDADDGSIDGSGNGGHAWFFSPGLAGLAFTFDPLAPGGLPVEAGLVWTDGAGSVSFEAFDENGFSLGVHGPFDLADASVTGETAEDRFLGVTYPGGISGIVASNTEGGIEVDHLQVTAPAIDACGPQPREDCLGTAGPKTSKLVLSDKREALKWKWRSAPGGVAKSDYGDPTGLTGYTLCLHDTAGGVASLALEARIPPGEGWKESARGFSYKRRDGDPDGVQKVSLKAPAPGRVKPAKFRVQGRDLALPDQPLAQAPEVVAQLLGDGGTCFEARFATPASKNDEKTFKDVAD